MSWVETSNGNRISRDAHISGSHKILLNGNVTVNPSVTLNADVEISKNTSGGADPHIITIGKYSYLGKGCKVMPPILSIEQRDDVPFEIHSPIRIGSYSIVGENCEILLVSIGNRVLIEKGCKIGNLSIIYDCCFIREGCIIPPKAVIPPFSEVSGVPGVDFVCTELSNSYRKLIEGEARERYLLG